VFTKDSDIPEKDCLEFIRAYSSPSDFGHVFLFNLAYIKQHGGKSFATSGDYIAICGYDNTTKKQVPGSN